MRTSDSEVLQLALDELHRSVVALGDDERAWLDHVPLTQMVDALDRVGAHRSYRYVSPQVTETARQVRGRGGDEWLECYLRLLVLTLIARELHRPRLSLPQSVLEVRAVEFGAIVKRQPEGAPWPCDLAASRYLKDLGLARGILLGDGLRVVQRRPGLPVAILEACRESNAGLADTFERCGPWLEPHLLQRRSHEFTPEGWLRAGRVIADLLDANPEIAGFYGSSWLSDPLLGEVSPHLAWLPGVIAATGAHVFALGTDPDVVGDAIATSRTRRRLYEEGRYVPTRYARITPREPFLAWVRSQSEATGA